MESEILKAKDDQIRSLQAQLLERNRQLNGNAFQAVQDVVRNSSLTERETELTIGFKKYKKGKNGLPILQRKEKENLSKPCEQLFCCMVEKWHRHYVCPVEEDLEELAKVSLGVRCINYYRDWTSQEMAVELEKVFKGLDNCGGYCLCMKSGKFLKHVQSTVPDGKSLKGLFPKMVYIVPMQTDIIGMVDTNYNTEMIPCNDCGRSVPRVKLLSHKANNCFDDTRPSFDGVKTFSRPKVSTISQDNNASGETKCVSQANAMEIEAFVDSHAVQMPPQSNAIVTGDKSTPSGKQHLPAAMNNIIHASSRQSSYRRRVQSYRSRSSTSSSYETSGSSSTSDSRSRTRSNQSMSRKICHVDCSKRRPNSRKRTRSRETEKRHTSTRSNKDDSLRSSRYTSRRRSTTRSRRSYYRERSRSISAQPKTTGKNGSPETSKLRKRYTTYTRSPSTSKKCDKYGLPRESNRKKSWSRSTSRSSTDLSVSTNQSYWRPRSRGRSMSRTSYNLSRSPIPSKPSRSPPTEEKKITITSKSSNFTEKNFPSQEELLEYVKQVGGTIVSGKDLETMFPSSSEVFEIDVIEEHTDVQSVLPSCEVEVQKNTVNDDLFVAVNGKYPSFETVAQNLDLFLEEQQKKIDAAFAEDEDEEIDLEQLEMVINLLLQRVKSLRCLLYLENLGDEVTTMRAYKARNRCESILGVLHNSPHSLEHYVNVADFIEKRLDLIVGDGKPRDRNFVLEVLVPESLNFAIMDVLNV